MKYILFLILGIILASAAFISFNFGSKYKIQLTPKISEPTSPPSLFPVPTSKQTKIVKGGGILSFPKYELTVPIDWTDSREVPGPDAERIILKKGEYQISILEGGFGGAICLFPGDPDIEGPSGRYDIYVELTTKSGNLFRRVGTAATGGFSICEKTQYGWNSPSSYGHISIKTPTSPSPEVLSEIDSILSSFKKL